jgi:hypothetical protein
MSTHRAACSDGAPRGTGGGGQRLDDLWEGVHKAHPWPSVHLPGTVQGTRSQLGGRMTEGRSSSARSTAPELNDGEGAGPSGRGAALRSDEAPEPTHMERGGVRWLGTDGVAKKRGKRGGDGLSEMDKRHWHGRDATGGASFYSRAPRRAMWARRGR